MLLSAWSLALENGLSQLETFGYSLALTLIYTGCLYLRSATRPSKTRLRDAPSTVLDRLVSISVSTLFSVLALPAVLAYYNHLYGQSYWYAFSSLHIFSGAANGNLFAALIVLPAVATLVTSLLFLGPILNLVYFEHKGSVALLWDSTRRSLTSVYGLRNFVFGPVTEELVFRACIIAVYLARGTDRPTMIFVTPLYFGAAHIHHAYEMYLEAQIKSKLQIACIVLFQFLYTTVFGCYAAYLFLTTSSVWTPIAVHILCNVLGVPEWTLDTRKKTLIYRVFLFVGIAAFLAAFPLIHWTATSLNAVIV